MIGGHNDRSVPFEDRRDREPCRLARLSWADDDGGLLLASGGDELAGVSPEGEAAGPALPDPKKTHVRWARPSVISSYDVSACAAAKRSGSPSRDDDVAGCAPAAA